MQVRVDNAVSSTGNASPRNGQWVFGSSGLDSTLLGLSERAVHFALLSNRQLQKNVRFGAEVTTCATLRGDVGD